MSIEQLNFHHLRYFWAVAKDGNLTRTAARMRVAQSALSSQIQQLEAQLGLELFQRDGRRLLLTEAGKITLDYAERIFTVGSEMMSTLERGRDRAEILRIGAVATLSRNFQESVVKPLLELGDIRLYLESGLLVDLIGRLENHVLDLVLANRLPSPESSGKVRYRRLARQPVSIVGQKRHEGFAFPGDLANVPIILPGRESAIRSEFDALCEQLGVSPRILAEVDDMATMRLLARDTAAYALLPSVVVRDELRAGVLYEHCVIPGLFETFYAITAQRGFQHPLLSNVLEREERELLAMDSKKQLLQAD